MCIDADTEEWLYWMDRPPLAARNLITMNIPDAADIEELLKQADNIPKGGWRKLQYTPEVIGEIAAMFRKDDEPPSPLEP
jgi:hypothetical protein